LDVHARSVLAASMDSETRELRVRRLSGVTNEVVEFCASLPGPCREPRSRPAASSVRRT
jgi:hypothetical protein